MLYAFFKSEHASLFHQGGKLRRKKVYEIGQRRQLNFDFQKKEKKKKNLDFFFKPVTSTTNLF